MYSLGKRGRPVARIHHPSTDQPWLWRVSPLILLSLYSGLYCYSILKLVLLMPILTIQHEDHVCCHQSAYFCYQARVIHVEYEEHLLEHGPGLVPRQDHEHRHELVEADDAVPVGVVDPEDVQLDPLRLLRREVGQRLADHLAEAITPELSVGVFVQPGTALLPHLAIIIPKYQCCKTLYKMLQ